MRFLLDICHQKDLQHISIYVNCWKRQSIQINKKSRCAPISNILSIFFSMVYYKIFIVKCEVCTYRYNLKFFKKIRLNAMLEIAHILWMCRRYKALFITSNKQCRNPLYFPSLIHTFFLYICNNELMCAAWLLIIVSLDVTCTYLPTYLCRHGIRFLLPKFLSGIIYIPLDSTLPWLYSYSCKHTEDVFKWNIIWNVRYVLVIYKIVFAEMFMPVTSIFCLVNIAGKVNKTHVC